MRIHFGRWMVAALLSPMLFGTTLHGETIHHGIPRWAGNSIPEGSQSICPGVPDNVGLIPYLKSGFAIAEPSSTALQLVFSDQVLACGTLDTFGLTGTTRETCESAWQFALTIPRELQTPGLYRLSDHQVDYAQTMVTGGSGEGCSNDCLGPGGTGTGGGPAGSGPPGVMLEIYSVTDECITGRLQGLTTGQITPPPPEFNGAFHAVRCVPFGAR